MSLPSRSALSPYLSQKHGSSEALALRLSFEEVLFPLWRITTFPEMWRKLVRWQARPQIHRRLAVFVSQPIHRVVHARQFLDPEDFSEEIKLRGVLDLQLLQHDPRSAAPSPGRSAAVHGCRDP